MDNKIKFSPTPSEINSPKLPYESVEEVKEGNIELIKGFLQQGQTIDDACNQVFGPVLKTATLSEKAVILQAIAEIKESIGRSKELY